MVDKGRLDRARVAAFEGRIEAATNIARTIVEDWYRCQALTQIAEHLPDRSKVLSMLSEALEAAYLTEEPNRIVVVGALPIEVLSQTREFSLLQVEVDKLIDVANSEPHPTRRIDAFYWLWSRLRTGRLQTKSSGKCWVSFGKLRRRVMGGNEIVVCDMSP